MLPPENISLGAHHSCFSNFFFYYYLFEITCKKYTARIGYVTYDITVKFYTEKRILSEHKSLINEKHSETLCIRLPIIIINACSQK